MGDEEGPHHNYFIGVDPKFSDSLTEITFLGEVEKAIRSAMKPVWYHGL